MSDINPYRPAVEISELDQDHTRVDPGWAFRRLAAASSGIGTMLVGASLLFGADSQFIPFVILLVSGIGLIASGYYWHGREVRQAIVCALVGLGVPVSALMLFG